MILETVWISAGPLCLKDDSGMGMYFARENIFSREFYYIAREMDLFGCMEVFCSVRNGII